jgi:hypothetical protein
MGITGQSNGIYGASGGGTVDTIRVVIRGTDERQIQFQRVRFFGDWRCYYRRNRKMMPDANPTLEGLDPQEYQQFNVWWTRRKANRWKPKS